MLFTYIEDIYFDLIVFYFMKPLEAQMFQCRDQLLLVNLLRHRCCGAEVIYFVFSSEMENRTLSQMCGRLYLPVFLLRAELLTLMYITSFIEILASTICHTSGTMFCFPSQN